MTTKSKDESKKVIDEIFSAETFQSAMQEICGAAKILDEAQSNPYEFFKHFGVNLPKDCDIEIVVKEVGAQGKTKAAVPGMKIICVSWCTKNNCYTYCAVFQHHR